MKVPFDPRVSSVESVDGSSVRRLWSIMTTSRLDTVIRGIGHLMSGIILGTADRIFIQHLDRRDLTAHIPGIIATMSLTLTAVTDLESTHTEVSIPLTRHISRTLDDMVGGILSTALLLIIGVNRA